MARSGSSSVSTIGQRLDPVFGEPLAHERHTQRVGTARRPGLGPPLENAMDTLRHVAFLDKDSASAVRADRRLTVSGRV